MIWNCGCGNIESGGISRIIGYLRQRENSDIILNVGGNYCADTEVNVAIRRAMSTIAFTFSMDDYDGEYEFKEESDSFELSSAARGSRSETCNLIIGEKNSEFIIFGLNNEYHQDNLVELKRHISENKSLYAILIVNVGRDRAINIIKSTEGLDMVIYSDRAYDVGYNLYGGAVMINTGKRGLFITKLTLDFNKLGIVESYDRVKMDEKNGKDNEIEKILDKYVDEGKLMRW